MSVFIIAEAGVNHNGDIELAKKLVDAAVRAGVDAVKFQTWKTELLVTESAAQADYQRTNTGKAESQYAMLKRLELSYNDFIELKAYCDDVGIMFLSTADEVESALFLADLQDIFKIGSGELTNIPFLRQLGSLQKKIILSTGMGKISDIELALEALTGAGTPCENITVLHATTEYPTPMREVNLNAMLTIKNTFGVDVGYSDHTMGIEVPIAATAIGATVIEKHFTLSRSMKGPDHKASLEPDELKEMVAAIRNIEVAMGNGVKKPQPSELLNQKVVEKKIVAKVDIQKGDILSEDSLTCKRMGFGISAKYWDVIVGTAAVCSFKQDEEIRLCQKEKYVL